MVFQTPKPTTNNHLMGHSPPTGASSRRFTNSRVQSVVCMRCLERDLKGWVEAICHANAPSTKRTRIDTIFMYCVFANALRMEYR